MKKWLHAMIVLALVAMSFVVLAQDTEMGDMITVTGTANIVSPNAFILENTSPEQFSEALGDDLSAADVLVFPGPAGDFPIDINNGLAVQVTGELRSFNLGDVETETGLDVDDTLYTDYGGDDYYIVADNVRRLAAREQVSEATITDLQANPQNYFGQTITIDGTANILSPNVFELANTDPYTFDTERVLVMPGQDDDFMVDINNGLRVQVTGELTSFNQGELEQNRLGYELDDAALADYNDQDLAIIARSVRVLSAVEAADPALAQDFAANAPNYVGQTLTVQGTANIISPNAFVLENTQPYNLEAMNLIVVPGLGTDGDFGTDINNGLEVQVIGELAMFNITDLETRLGYDLDDNAFADYGTDDYVLIASNVIPVSDEEYIYNTEPVTTFGVELGQEGLDDEGFTDEGLGDDEVGTEGEGFGDALADDPYAALDAITDDPTAYYGQTVTVAGTVTELVVGGTGGFIIEEEDLIGDDHALVIPQNTDLFANTVWALDEDVLVTGVVRPLVITDLEAEIGYDLDDALYTGYEGYPAIIANQAEYYEGDPGLLQ